jgi:predicted protein tyrosine phosphatase
MAQIYIFSYRQFNKVMEDMGWNDSNIDNLTNTAIVSICDTDGSMPHWFKEQHHNVLNIEFDDNEHPVPGANIIALTENQAKLIVDFYENNINVEYFIVHCAAGISRSAAVATCFMDFLHMHNIKGHTLHKNFSYCPNSHVERLLHQEFMRRN